MKREADAARIEDDAFIDEILSWDWESNEPTQAAVPANSEPAQRREATAALMTSQHAALMDLAKLDGVIQRIVDAFVARRCSSACLVATAIVANQMGRGEVVEGYQIADEIKGYGRHYWYRLDGVDYDVGTLIALRVIPLIKPSARWWVEGRTIRLSTEPPTARYTYWCGVDADDEAQCRKLEKSYRAYKQTPHKFWKQAPRWMRELAT